MRKYHASASDESTLGAYALVARRQREQRRTGRARVRTKQFTRTALVTDSHMHSTGPHRVVLTIIRLACRLRGQQLEM